MEPYIKESKVKKVFIIEDNEMHSMMMDYLLSKENSFNIFRFKSGEEGLKRLNISPDLVILDYGLPGINGMETFRQIKKHNPGVPVVVISENRNRDLKTRFIKEGAYQYITKGPNSFHELNTVVDSILTTLSAREYKKANRVTFFLVAAFILLIILSCVISYQALRH